MVFPIHANTTVCMAGDCLRLIAKLQKSTKVYLRVKNGRSFFFPQCSTALPLVLVVQGGRSEKSGGEHRVMARRLYEIEPPNLIHAHTHTHTETCTPPKGYAA